MVRVRLVPIAIVPKRTVSQKGITTANSTMVLPRSLFLRIESFIGFLTISLSGRATGERAGLQDIRRGCVDGEAGIGGARIRPRSLKGVGASPVARHHPEPRKARYADFHQISTRIAVGAGSRRDPGVGRRVKLIII